MDGCWGAGQLEGTAMNAHAEGAEPAVQCGPEAMS